jgi:hypothetical protein
MSDCERYERIISMQIDGEAGESDLTELEKHLAECADCRAWQAGQLRLDTGLSRALAEWRESLGASIRPVPAPAGGGLRLAWAAAAAVLISALTLGALLAGYRWGRGSADGNRPAPDPQPAVAHETPAPADREDQDLGKPLPPGPYFAETERSVPVMEGLVWDREHGLRSAKYIDKEKTYTVLVPRRGIELEWTTSDREVRLVGLEEE